MSKIRNNHLLSRVSEVLKDLRLSQNKSQESVINDIKIQDNVNIHLGRIETSQSDITISTISLLCEYYQISLSEFFKLVELKK